ncbi:MAG: hypothetical protein Q7U51_11395 [Methanoregula sp.]|nr:hypothetical protein [Methanoregula sp.]
MARPGLGFARFGMVLASFWPLFLLWAIRGSPVIEDWILFFCCGSLIVIPNALVLIRIYNARSQNDTKLITVENAQDHRDHILIYLIAILIPVYSLPLDAWRNIAALIVALILVITIFWLLDLHYLNLFFTIFDYRIYTINPDNRSSQTGRRDSFVIITKKTSLIDGEEIRMHRISDSIFIDLS